MYYAYGISIATETHESIHSPQRHLILNLQIKCCVITNFEVHLVNTFTLDPG